MQAAAALLALPLHPLVPATAAISAELKQQTNDQHADISQLASTTLASTPLPSPPSSDAVPAGSNTMLVMFMHSGGTSLGTSLGLSLLLALAPALLDGSITGFLFDLLSMVSARPVHTST
jgi:hypothetical protein